MTRNYQQQRKRSKSSFLLEILHEPQDYLSPYARVDHSSASPLQLSSKRTDLQKAERMKLFVHGTSRYDVKNDPFRAYMDNDNPSLPGKNYRPSTIHPGILHSTHFS